MGVLSFVGASFKPWPPGIFFVALIAAPRACGGVPSGGHALKMPKWFVDRDECYIEYCNNYDDVQRKLCCPPGEKKEQRSDGQWYCTVETTCTALKHLEICKEHATGDGLQHGRLKQYIFSKECGGTAHSLETPFWLPDKDACWIEYCNYYSDLQRDMCCPPGAKRTVAENTNPYCFDEKEVTCNVGNSQQVQVCKKHAKTIGIYEGRVRPHAFSPNCGGTTQELTWPDWLPDLGYCWIQYCNHYDDLQRSFCCPTGVVTTKGSDGKYYCSKPTSCDVEHSQHVRDCKQSAISSHHRLKRYIFSTECGGVTKVRLPEWLVDNDICWIQYCNHYSDLRKAECCPPGAQKQRASNGESYCSNDHPTCTTQHAAMCKDHAVRSGVYEGRVRKYIFSPGCGGTSHENAMEDELLVSGPRGVSMSQVAIGFILCGFLVFCVWRLYLRYAANNSKNQYRFEAELGDHPSTIGGHGNESRYYSMSTPREGTMF